jgi:hypothetical protein
MTSKIGGARLRIIRDVFAKELHLSDRRLVRPNRCRAVGVGARWGWLGGRIVLLRDTSGLSLGLSLTILGLSGASPYQL